MVYLEKERTMVRRESLGGVQEELEGGMDGVRVDQSYFIIYIVKLKAPILKRLRLAAAVSHLRWQCTVLVFFFVPDSRAPSTAS